jgi:hypothetical protein
MPIARPRCFNRRAALAAVVKGLALVSGHVPAQPTGAGAAAPEYAGPLFDAHLHYNDEAVERFRSTTCSAACRRAACARSSRTAVRTTARARSPPRARRRAVPASPWCRSCAMYRNRADYSGWHADPTIVDMVLRELAAGTDAGPYRGLGEFHLYDSRNADGRPRAA